MTRGAVAAVVFLVLSGMTGRAQSGCLDEDDAAARSGNYDLAIEYYSNCIDDGGLAPIDLAAAFFSRGKMHHI